MTPIITVAYLSVLACALFVLIRWPRLRLQGEEPVGLFTLIALLFTAGLDMGLVMLPLAEFPIYEEDPAFGFTNALAVEFGMWGPLVWLMYFVATFYFIALEPRLQLFQIPAVKWVYNLTVIATCSFTCYLFMSNLPTYAPDLPQGAVWALVVVVIATAVLSSGNMAVMKWLAIISSYGFGMLAFTALAMIAFVYSRVGLGDFFDSVGLLGGYFAHLPRFATPISDYHEFYLFWWFAWSIMIGQFTSRFVGGLKTWQVLASLLVFPSIPLGIWFSVLYFYHLNGIETTLLINISMVAVGIIFVINSFDSLIRLYTDNLNLSAQRLGTIPYVLGNAVVLFGLTLAFQSQWLQIQWIGTAVIGIYVACLAYIILFKRSEVMSITASPEENVLDFNKIKTAH